MRVHVASSSCPDAALLKQQLEPLLGPDATLTFDESELGRSDAGHASVRDLGERYVVEIRGLRRELPDARHDCVERARVAAVFIALNLPDAQVPAAPTPPARETPVPPRAAEPLHVGLQLFGEGAYATEIDRGAPGVGAGVWLGYLAFRFDASIGVLAATEITLEPRDGVRGSVELMRLPLTLSANYALQAGRLQFGPTLGFELDVLHLRGRNLVRAQSEWRLNPGALLALDARLVLASVWSGWLRVGVSSFPRAYDLSVDPAGKLGQTPRWWLHAKLGIAWQFR